MAIFEWRKFDFFYLKKDVDDGKLGQALKDATIKCTANGNNQIIICDSYGCIHIFNRNWEASTFKGHDGSIELCELSRHHNLLITIGNEDNGTLPVFKIWNLSKTSKIDGGITLPCLQTDKIALQKPTAIGVSENGNFMAIGFDRGSISLYRGDISRDRKKNLKTISVDTTPITGIAFKQQGKTVHMFVCSDSGVFVYNLQNKDKEYKTVLDKTVAAARCCALQTTQGINETHFMVGRDDAVYCYTIDGRGPCYALEGEKSIIQWFRSHLLTISKPTKSSMPPQKYSVLTVIDILNKFIVFSTQLESAVAIFIEFGTCYIITANKTVYHLDEKDLQSKLKSLFGKKLYDIAVGIAKSNQYDLEGLSDIFRQYGDHLYIKGDYEGAVEQYIKTIDYLEPSYVIRQFLDSRHINYLTDYLQALHERGKATADHTTLLLNCYTRLDQTDQLKEFLGNDKNPNVMFDLDVAIKVCRSASVEHALALAMRNGKHDACVSILTEDLKQYDKALSYVSHLPFRHAEEILKKYGNSMMKNCPERTTELLKRLCTGCYHQKADDGSSIDGIPDLNGQSVIDLVHNDASSDASIANPEDFIHLFVETTPKLLIDFLEHLLSNVETCSKLVYNTLIEHYLKQWKTSEHAENRLLEILHRSPTNECRYDRDHVLVLCSTHHFIPGIMHIYEEQQMYHLIVRHYLKLGDYNSLIATCKRLGPLQPSLWLQALSGLRNNKNAPSNLLSQVLQVIAQEKLQSPLQVLQCLAVENGPNLSSVRDYFFQVFQKDSDSTKNEEESVKKYRQQVESLKDTIKNLSQSPIDFRNNHCDTCNQPLCMPALYFLCQHAYHQDCMRGYSDNDRDCPVCHSKNAQLRDTLQAQSESRNQHETFHNLLNRSCEPFSVVAEYFGRGLFNKIVIVDEQDEVVVDQSKIQPPRNEVAKPAAAAKPDASSQYGPGAESKMRLEEKGVNNNSSANASLRAMPIPEGRMRLQEQSRYATSLQANISYSQPPTTKKYESTPHVAHEAINTLRSVPAASASKAIPKSSAAAQPKNPFDDDDDGGDAYDESKNPFADEPDTSAEPKTAKSAGKKPFSNYDSNLNPFS